MAKEDKTNMYLLALVGIVGFVAVVVLLMNAAGFSSDVTGEAYSAKTVKLGSSGLKSWNTGDCTTCGDGSVYCGTASAVCPTTASANSLECPEGTVEVCRGSTCKCEAWEN